MCYRFHNPSEERVIGYDVVPPLSDDVQLTVEEYRSKLYEMIMQRKLERRRRRKGEDARRNAQEGDNSRPTTVASEQHPPAEPHAEHAQSPAHHNNHHAVANGKYSPGHSPVGGRPPAGGGEGHSPMPKKYAAANKSGSPRFHWRS